MGGDDSTSARRGPDAALPSARRAIAVAAAVVVAVTGVALGLAYRAYAEERDATYARLEDEARAAAVRVDAALERRRQVLRVVAADLAIGDEDAERLDRYFGRLAPADLGFTGGIGWVDRDGNLRASWSEATRARIYLGDRDYVADTLRTGREHAATIAIGRLTPVTLLVLAVPTRAGDGAINGVLVGSIRLDRPTDIAPAAAAMLVETEGSLIAEGGRTLATPRRLEGARGLETLRRRRTGIVAGRSPLDGTGDRLVAFAAPRERGLLVLLQRDRATELRAARRDLAAEVALLLAAGLVALASVIWGSATQRGGAAARRRARDRAAGRDGGARAGGDARRGDRRRARPPAADRRRARRPRRAAPARRRRARGRRRARRARAPPRRHPAWPRRRPRALARRGRARRGRAGRALPLGDGLLALAWAATRPREGPSPRRGARPAGRPGLRPGPALRRGAGHRAHAAGRAPAPAAAAARARRRRALPPRDRHARRRRRLVRRLPDARRAHHARDRGRRRPRPARREPDGPGAERGPLARRRGAPWRAPARAPRRLRGRPLGGTPSRRSPSSTSTRARRSSPTPPPGTSRRSSSMPRAGARPRSTARSRHRSARASASGSSAR